jgi:uncharacterized protein involved in tolerance to divalent cations
MKRIDTETLEAKLRNKLTPAYSLASMVLILEKNSSPELIQLLIESAKLVEEKLFEIDTILEKIDNNRRADKKIDTSSLYGKCVQIDDIHNSVFIWDKELDEENDGRWKVKEIEKEKYLKEMKEEWNNE